MLTHPLAPLTCLDPESDGAGDASRSHTGSTGRNPPVPLTGCSETPCLLDGVLLDPHTGSQSRDLPAPPLAPLTCLDPESEWSWRYVMKTDAAAGEIERLWTAALSDVTQLRRRGRGREAS